MTTHMSPRSVRNLLRVLALLAIVIVALPAVASAQTDEVQVYDGGLATPGTLNLTLHNNFTPSGIKEPAFPGAIVSNDSLNGVPEWAYGVTNWFEAGLYLPLYSIDKDRGAVLDGFKLRTLFAVPNADERTFVYGVNFEFSYNARDWDPKRISLGSPPHRRLAPEPGGHHHQPDPRHRIRRPQEPGFAPSIRVAYNASDDLAVAVEEYAEYGPLARLRAQERAIASDLRSGRSHGRAHSTGRRGSASG